MTIPLKLSTILLFSAAIIFVVIIISLVNYYYVVAGSTNNNNDNNSIGHFLPNQNVLSQIIIPHKYVLHVMIFDIALVAVTLILRKGKIT
jgi:hypothetical protein